MEAVESQQEKLQRGTEREELELDGFIAACLANAVVIWLKGQESI